MGIQAWSHIDTFQLGLMWYCLIDQALDSPASNLKLIQGDISEQELGAVSWLAIQIFQRFLMYVGSFPEDASLDKMAVLLAQISR